MMSGYLLYSKYYRLLYSPVYEVREKEPSIQAVKDQYIAPDRYAVYVIALQRDMRRQVEEDTGLK